MSFNPDPTWASDIEYPEFSCPACGHIVTENDFEEKNLTHLTYYEARAIPPSIDFVCEECEEEFEYWLSAKIFAKRIDQDV